MIDGNRKSLPHTLDTSKFQMELRCTYERESLKLWGGNIGTYVSKGIHQKEEVLKYDYIEILHFCINEDTINRVKVQAWNWKKIS